MASSLVVSPTYPVEGQQVTLSITGSGQDTFVFEITAVPSESAIPTGFLVQPQGISETQIAQTTAQIVADSGYGQNSFTPDVAGEYSITVYEFRETLGYTAGYDADPQADERLDLIAVTDFNLTAGVIVGAYMDLALKTIGEDEITLRLNVANVTVRAASMVNHKTEKARQAALNVTTELAALIGKNVTTFGEDLQTGANDLRNAYEGHRTQVAAPVVHSAADQVNPANISDAQSTQGAIELLNTLRDIIGGHLSLSSSQPAGAGLRWHEWSAGNVDDFQNVPIVDKATTLAEATVLLSELRWRVYDRHRVQDDDTVGDAPVHDNEDTANTLTGSASELDDLIIAYLDAIQDATPTAAANENQGAVDLAHRFGFKRFISTG